MAIDNRLQIFYENGNPVDYDIMATDVKFADGKDLPTKLAEMEQEIGQGGYTPPEGGIPKTDLAPAVQQTLDNVANKVDKVTGKGLSSNDYTDTDKAKVDGLKTVATSGSYTDLTDKPTIPTVPTMDSTPTQGNTTHMVSSDGVAAAIAAKANAADVPTKTEMADAIDDALGEAQVTVVPEGSVGVISSLGSDSDSDALSASMGKKLKVAIITILNSLGNYAFTDGKPVIDWGDDTPVTFTVSKTIGTGLSATGGDTDVDLGDSLEVTIAITDNLYVVDDDSVVVTMGGRLVQGAWSASTMKVTIAAVTGNVVINVPSLTYEPTNLAFHLDCMNGVTKSGSTPTKWTDLIGNKEFVLTNVTEAQGGGMHFNGLSDGGSTAVYSGGALAVAHDAGTIEFVTETTGELKQFTSILFNGHNGGICALCQKITAITGILTAFTTENSQENKLMYNTNVIPAAMSMNINNGGSRAVLVNGAAAAAVASNYYFLPGANNTGMMAVGCYVNASDGVAFERSDQPITIKAIRVYSQKLTLQQAQKNYAIDKKRFNLA